MALHLHADGIVNDRAPRIKAGDRVFLARQGAMPYVVIQAGAHSAVLQPVIGPSRTWADNGAILLKPETPIPLVIVRRLAARLFPGAENAKIRKTINAFAADVGADLAAGTYPRGYRPWLMGVLKDPALDTGMTCARREAVTEINEAFTGPAACYPWDAGRLADEHAAKVAGFIASSDADMARAAELHNEITARPAN